MPSVFISWSGPKSKGYAEALYEWLPDVIQDSDPWMSADIEAGERWDAEIKKALDAAKVGIICCTQYSITRPWLIFEAGAIARTFAGEETRRVIPYLIDIQPTDLANTPLASFQGKRADKAGTLDVLRSIASAIGSNVDQSRLGRFLELHWTDLSSAFKKAEPDPEVVEDGSKSADEPLDEVRQWMRQISRQMAAVQGQRGSLFASDLVGRLISSEAADRRAEREVRAQHFDISVEAESDMMERILSTITGTSGVSLAYLRDRTAGEKEGTCTYVFRVVSDCTARPKLHSVLERIRNDPRVVDVGVTRVQRSSLPPPTPSQPPSRAPTS